MDVLQIDLMSLNLAPGLYFMGVGIGQGSHLMGIVDYDVVLNVLHFRIGELESSDGTIGVWSPGWGNIVHARIRLSRSAGVSSLASEPMANHTRQPSS